MHIRLVQLKDAEAILDIYKPYITSTATTFETSVPAVEAFEERIKTNTEKYPWLVAEDEGKIIGYAYASKHRDREAYQWCVECSVYVLEQYHHSGIAKELYTKLFELLQRSGYVNVYAGVTLPNPKSVAFHTKMGFEPIGVYRDIGYKLGQWHDVAWMVKTINPHREDPPVPQKAE
jgi:phosphinothricin acetyltransferase